MTTRSISVRTYDVDPRYSRSRSRDMLLTTNARLTAEPAPDAPNLGVRYDGTGGVPREPDDEAVAMAIVRGLGMLTAEGLAKVKATVAKYGSSGTTSQVGITSNDARREALTAVRDVRRGVDAVASINKANADFWGPRVDADTNRVYR